MCFTISDALQLVFVLIAVTIFWSTRQRHTRLGLKHRVFPPGPFNLHITKYLPFLIHEPHKKLNELSKEYGPIYSVKLGDQYTVILTDCALIKEAYSKDVLAETWNLKFELPTESSEKSIETTMIHDGLSEEKRTLTNHILRDLELRKSIMGQLITEEIRKLIRRVMDVAGERLVDVSKMLTTSMSNNMTLLLFDKKKRPDDKKKIESDRNLREISSFLSETPWILFFPSITNMAQELGITKPKDLSNTLRSLNEYIDEEISELQKNAVDNDATDSIDGCLLAINRSCTNSTFKDPILRDSISFLYWAGTEPVRVSLDWLLLICATFHDVQVKVHAEIDTVFGLERFLANVDQKMMPYTTAVIMEMMRWINIVPVTMFRVTAEYKELFSYSIPKHSHVCANLWEVHYDPMIFGNDVEMFRPERFLSEDGDKIKNSEFLIPFFIGRTSWPAGDTLVNTEVFLYFTLLMRNFCFSLPDGNELDFKGQLGILRSPHPYELLCAVRG